MFVSVFVFFGAGLTNSFPYAFNFFHYTRAQFARDLERTREQEPLALLWEGFESCPRLDQPEKDAVGKFVDRFVRSKLQQALIAIAEPHDGELWLVVGRGLR